MKWNTEDGLPIVTEKILFDFLSNFDISSVDNDPEVMRRMELENPQIYRMLQLGCQEAPSEEARSYYKCGVQIVYELLRRQSRSRLT